MKKPVIALDNGGSREVVEQNKTGLLSAPQDIAALAENILTLMEIPDDRRIAENYSRGILMVDALPEYRKLFESLMQKIHTRIGKGERKHAYL